MKFTPIDFDSWKRKEIFYYFSVMAPTSYSVTTEVDITKLKKTLDERKLKFFPTYLYLVTKALKDDMEFSIAYEDDILGYYDYLTPMYAVFHEDDKTISLMWTEFKESYEEFYNSYLEDNKKYKDNHGVLSKKDILPPKNSYTVSCVPWVSFKSFSLDSHDNKKYFFPSIEAGKFYEKNGKIILPLSISCHHATTDGYHIDRFFKRLQNMMDEF